MMQTRVIHTGSVGQSPASLDLAISGFTNPDYLRSGRILQNEISDLILTPGEGHSRRRQRFRPRIKAKVEVFDGQTNPDGEVRRDNEIKPEWYDHWANLHYLNRIPVDYFYGVYDDPAEKNPENPEEPEDFYFDYSYYSDEKPDKPVRKPPPDVAEEKFYLSYHPDTRPYDLPEKQADIQDDQLKFRIKNKLNKATNQIGVRTKTGIELENSGRLPPPPKKESGFEDRNRFVRNRKPPIGPVNGLSAGGSKEPEMIALIQYVPVIPTALLKYLNKDNFLIDPDSSLVLRKSDMERMSDEFTYRRKHIPQQSQRKFQPSPPDKRGRRPYSEKRVSPKRNKGGKFKRRMNQGTEHFTEKTC